MKKIIIFSIIILFAPRFIYAKSFSDDLKGKILLQVESHGEAWYFDPVSEKRVYLGNPDDAYICMRSFGLGISEASYENFLLQVPKKFAGRIFIRVEAKGEAYYVEPISMKMQYLGRPKDTFKIMRKFGLGITNKELDALPMDDNYQSLDMIKEKSLRYIKDNRVSMGTKVELLSFVSDGCLYKGRIIIYGEELIFYVDKKFTKFFPQADDIIVDNLKDIKQSSDNGIKTVKQVKEIIHSYIKNKLLPGAEFEVSDLLFDGCLYNFKVTNKKGSSVESNFSYVNDNVTKILLWSYPIN